MHRSHADRDPVPGVDHHPEPFDGRDLLRREDGGGRRVERIGDLAVNIAERTLFLASQPPIDIPFDFTGMSDKAKLMLKKSLDALVNMDIKMAWEVCAMDDEVDAINREMYEQVQEGIRRRPDQMNSLIHCLSTSRHLERIADHATNIAEDVIYMVAGEIVRHKAEDFRPEAARPAV